MLIDKKQILAHKKLLHENEPAIFQAFPEKGSNARPSVFSGTMDYCGPKIEEVVRSGIAVGIVVNKFRGGVRKTENVERVTGFFVDLDGGVTIDDIERFPIKPHLVTETSPGRYHAFWRVDGCPLNAFRSIQAILAKRLGGDPNVIDVTRAMRLAGTPNRKNGQAHVVQIVSIAEGEARTPIAFGAFLRGFDIKRNNKPAPQVGPTALDIPELADVQTALEKIPAEERHVWLHVGMALHSILPNADGKSLWDQWSKKATGKFDEAEQDRAWRNFQPNRGITKGTLFYYANRYSPGVVKIDVPTTEVDLAKLFAATYKGEVAFDHHSSQWWVFDGIWKKSQHLALRRCKEMLESMIETVRSRQAENERGLLSAVQRQTTTSALTAILRQTSLDPALEMSASGFDGNPDLLGVDNGVVELHSGQHRPARSTDFITLRCSTAYDARAMCPTFISFIESITEGDTEFARYIQRAFGYSTFGHTREQVFFMIAGPGANGKGVLLRTINKVLGDYGRTVAPNLLQRAYTGNPNSPSPAVITLKGARLYACTEFDGNKRFDEAFVKQLSGSDILTGRSNFGEQETFTPAGKLWLSLNSDPEIAYDNAAMWRRLRVIPLMRRFSGKNCDPDLEVKLSSELPGILNWLVEGARHYHTHGLGACTKVTLASEKLRARSDTVRSWFAACCTVRDGAAIQGASDVYRSYSTHTRNNNRTPLPISKFNARLEKLGFVHVRRSASNGWKGFIIKGD